MRSLTRGAGTPCPFPALASQREPPARASSPGIAQITGSGPPGWSRWPRPVRSTSVTGGRGRLERSAGSWQSKPTPVGRVGASGCRDRGSECAPGGRRPQGCAPFRKRQSSPERLPLTCTRGSASMFCTSVGLASALSDDPERVALKAASVNRGDACLPGAPPGCFNQRGARGGVRSLNASLSSGLTTDC